MTLSRNYQTLLQDTSFRGKAQLAQQQKFSVIPDSNEGSPKAARFKFIQANNRLAINRIKLFDGAKNMEDFGFRGNQSIKGSVVSHGSNAHINSSTYAHSIIESLRASKAALTSG